MPSTFSQGFQPWWIFNDKFGKPLAGGKIWTYDSLTRDPKATYKDAGGLDANENPLTLDAAGMFETAVYWEENGTSLYFIQVYDRDGNLEREEDNVPASGGGGGGPINEYFESTNYIDNIDFKFNDGAVISPVPVGDTPVAPGGWFFRKAENFAVFDDIVFTKITPSPSSPPYNPEFFLTYTATSFSGSETEKALLKKISKVKSLSNEVITFSFSTFSNLASTPAEILVVQHFGTGGSPSPDNIQLLPFNFPGSGIIEETFTVDDVFAKSFGTNEDDYVAIGVRYPLTTPGRFSMTRFSIIRGDLMPPNGFFDTPSQTFYKCMQDFLSFYTTGFTISYFVDYGIIKGVPTKYAIEGFLGLEDQTIGSASSGAVEANSKYKNLFVYLWQSIPDAFCPVSGGRGASADADWAANKTIRLPQVRGRSKAVAGAGTGLTPRAIGEYLGEENHLLTVPEMPAHTHTLKAQLFFFDQDNPNGSVYNVTNGPGTLQTSSSGSNQPHNTMQPTYFIYDYIKY